MTRATDGRANRSPVAARDMEGDERLLAGGGERVLARRGSWELSVVGRSQGIRAGSRDASACRLVISRNPINFKHF
jgi:hypothetical protein